MRVAVVIATTGRRDTVEQTAPLWTAQTRPYDRLIFSVVSQDDIGPVAAALPRAEILFSAKGLTKQRNCALDHLASDCDVVIFADDDFVPSVRFTEATRDTIMSHPDIAMLSGYVLADGINAAGISFDDATAIVAEYDSEPVPNPPAMDSMPHAYGCNMAIRLSADPGLRFDERLPLYGWLEDLDYSRRIADRGRLIRTNVLAGVHMGTKRGRQSGVKLGYSQVANPLYFVGKGTMPASEAIGQVSRNVVANLVRCVRPEPWVDRMGRLRGNFMAIGDAALGRMKPERIEDL